MVQAKKQSIDFIKKHSEEVTDLLTREHRKLIEKLQHWVDVALSKSERNAYLEEFAKNCEMYSAKTNPVLEMLYGLDLENPLVLYDCIVPTLKEARHANPYDCFDLEEIKDWHKVKREKH